MIDKECIGRIRKVSGYSLVEVMITIAIIGVVAAIAIPSFKGLMPKLRLNNDTMILSNEVSLSRVRAIAKSVRFKVKFNTASNSYALQREIIPTLPALPYFSTITTNNMSGSKFVSVTGFTDADEVIADTNGAMSVSFGGKGYITVKTPDGSIQKRVVVEPVGRVTVERSFDGGTSWQVE